MVRQILTLLQWLPVLAAVAAKPPAVPDKDVSPTINPREPLRLG